MTIGHIVTNYYLFDSAQIQFSVELILKIHTEKHFVVLFWGYTLYQGNHESPVNFVEVYSHS